MSSRRQSVRGWAVVAAGLLAGPLPAAEPPALRELRAQRVGEATYFHARFAAPADYLPANVEQATASELQRRLLARLPQLVPQDRAARAVYPRVKLPDYRPRVGFDADARPPVPVDGLEFVGRVQGGGPAKFLLIYPLKPPAPVDLGENDPLVRLRVAAGDWAEVPVALDFTKATRVPDHDLDARRRPEQPPARDDLQGLWAAAQAARFAVLEAQTPDFGFYGFAAAATERRYGVHAPMLERGKIVDRDKAHLRLYEMTTGAASLTESLQLHRLLTTEGRDRGRRTIDVSSVPGIDIAEHPWEKMMAGQKPAPESLARLVPHDNYYVHFKSLRKFIDFGELLDQWGTNLIRGYELTSRDYDIKGAYEKQLCLRSTWLGKTLGPLVIRGVAVTGNDPYLREGSDVTVIFHVANRPLFLSAVEQFLREARAEFGGRLKEGKADYHGVPVESFVTPQREVSLHRAVLGEFVIYANSPTGLRRVLDAHHARIKCLADSLDFQYMRTVFRADDEGEDGFAFLSDAFIRQLVGPASKIKEKRRLEAFASLSMVTNAALFAAWETGSLPHNQTNLLEAADLKPGHIYVPDGQGVTWDDSDRQGAVSDVYNTLHFVTPLIELPINQITPEEQQEYLQFREQYLRLWRQFFDPVGMRVSLRDGRVQLETYILPMIRSREYDFLRQLTAGGTTGLDPAGFPAKALLQGTVHLGPWARQMLEQFVFRGNFKVSDQLVVRVHDSRFFDRLARLWIGQELDPQSYAALQRELSEVTGQLPITAGVKVKDPKAFANAMQDFEWFGGQRKPLDAPYKGVTVYRSDQSQKVYDALVDAFWSISPGEQALREVIDHAAARRPGKESARKAEIVPINASLYLAPGALDRSRDAFRLYLEWAGHRRALPNCSAWYVLHRGGLIRHDATEKAAHAAARRYLGYVPVSPDGAAYAYEVRTDEVVNRRHGSYRRPRLHPGVEEASPLGRLLGEFRTLRADLRFREDGIHTTLTLERNGAKR